MTQPIPAPSASTALVLAQVASAQSQGLRLGQVPSVTGTVSLRALPPPLDGIISARMAAGYDAEGFDYPRAKGWFRAVIPFGLLGAVLEAGAAIGGLLDLVGAHLMPGWLGYSAVAAGAVSGAVASGAAISIRRDPLRLDRTARRQIVQSRVWHSSQPWIGPAYAGPERQLIAVAGAAVERIVASPAWSDVRTQQYWARPDLSAELEQIDQQAYRIASLRGTSAEADAHIAAAWPALVGRVAALFDYESALTASAVAAPPAGAPALAPIAELASGTANDELAAQQMRDQSPFNPGPPSGHWTPR
jgi:hypothetical protein